MIKPLLKEDMNEFTLEEAVSLIYKLAVLKNEKGRFPNKPNITQLGHICGVLTLNDQLEVVIKFHDEIRQFTKQEFLEKVRLQN